MANDSGKTVTADDIIFLTENTNFSSDKILEFYKNFKKQHPDGYLSYERFKSLTSSTGQNEAQIKLGFQMLDKDGNGTLDFKEFVLATNFATETDPRKKLEFVFDLYDIDKNGTIERSEMIRVFEALIPVELQREISPRTIAAEMFKDLDLNRDGVISKSEFVTGCLRYPELKQALMK